MGLGATGTGYPATTMSHREGGVCAKKLSVFYKCTVIISNVTCSEALMRRATNVARKNLVSLGTCIGKFTKSGKFHLQITALDIIAPYAKVGVSF